MSYILEGIYLGSLDDVYKTEDLLKKGVTHILTIDGRPLTKDVYKNFYYHYIHALDMETMDMLGTFEEAFSYIEAARKQGAVIIHCYAGQSRSATVVLAYLMHTLTMTFEDAVTFVKKQRPAIGPNPGFLEQLQLFERMGNVIDANCDSYKLYKLNILSIKMQTAKYSDKLLNSCLSSDPSIDKDGKSMFKCRKCRRALFKESAVLTHYTGKGEVAFDWRGSYLIEGDDSKAEVVCEKSVFIEPIEWMKPELYEIEGKLNCPKCFAKLGSFKWTGERCPCGTWITPAFHIQRNKVDLFRPHRPVMNINHSNVQGNRIIPTTVQSKTKDTETNIVNGVSQALGGCNIHEPNSGVSKDPLLIQNSDGDANLPLGAELPPI